MKKNTFLCHQIPTYQLLIEQKDLKTALLTETETEDAFIERAAHTIQQLVIHAAYGRGDQASRLLSELRTLGYSESDIARALAVAWLHESETFELPKVKSIEKFYRKGGLPILTLVLTVLGMTAFILGERHVFSEIIGTMLVFPPLLAIPATIVYIIIYLILSKIWKK